LPKEVLEEKSITLEEVQKTLKENEEKGELSYIQRVTLDYAIKFSHLNSEAAKKFVSELQTDFSLDLDTAIQIVNCMPSSLGELRAFLVGTKESTLSQEQQKEIVDRVKKALSH